MHQAPPCKASRKAASFFHIKRSHFQSLIWGNALGTKSKLLSKINYAWRFENGQLKPKFMSFEPVPRTCIQPAYMWMSIRVQFLLTEYAGETTFPALQGGK